MALPIKPTTKVRKWINNGLVEAEISVFLQNELAEDGYAGCDLRATSSRLELVILTTRPQPIIGERGQRIRELTAMIERRFRLKPGEIELYVERILSRGLCARIQAESLRYKLTGGLPLRRACYGVLRFIMNCGAEGCEIRVAGKINGQRAKAIKFSDGHMIHSGDPVNFYLEKATRIVSLRQGVLGIKIRIMLKQDEREKFGPKKPLPDKVVIFEPKEEKKYDKPCTEPSVKQDDDDGDDETSA